MVKQLLLQFFITGFLYHICCLNVKLLINCKMLNVKTSFLGVCMCGMCTMKELFYCQSLRYLFISDNELIEIPSMIGSLIHLEQLDISRNG